jgi:hypothetical protein
MFLPKVIDFYRPTLSYIRGTVCEYTLSYSSTFQNKRYLTVPPFKINVL